MRFLRHARQSNPGSATRAEREEQTSKISSRTRRKQDTAALRELDREINPRHFNNPWDAWTPGAQGLIVLSTGIWNVAIGEWWGIALVGLSIAFFVLTVRGVRWRWRLDVQQAYFRGQIKKEREHATSLIEDFRRDLENL